jgi:hypothetical protein
VTSSLTDRYIAATLRSLPQSQRPDIERELRASIADAVDARLEAGIDAADAETQVLSGLGDPARLAATYADRPLHLIGPGLFLDYTRVLTVLLSTVPPILLVVVGMLRVLNGDPPGAVARGAIVAVLMVALHIAFWTTLVFVVVERSPAMRQKLTRHWDPRSLPEVSEQRLLSAELIGGVVVATLGISLVVLSHTVGPVTDAAGEPIGIVAEELWHSGALYLFFLFFAASVTFHFVAVYVGWGVPYAMANALLSVLFAVPVVWLAAADRLLNDEFFTAVGWAQGSEVPTLVTTIVVVGVISMSLANLIDGFARARRPMTRLTS